MSRQKSKKTRQRKNRKARKAKAQSILATGGTLLHYTTQTGDVLGYPLADEGWSPAQAMAMLERITGPGRYSLPESLCLGVTEMWVVQVPGAITFDLCYPMPEMVEATKALVGMTDVAAGSPLRDALDAGFVPVTMNTVVAQPGKAWPYFKRLLSGSLTKEPACPYLVTSVMPMAVLLPVAVRGRLAVAERLIAKRLLQILGLIQ